MYKRQFIELLEEGGLINVHTEGSEHYLLVSELPDVERYSRMYYDLSINMEGDVYKRQELSYAFTRLSRNFLSASTG